LADLLIADGGSHPEINATAEYCIFPLPCDLGVADKDVVFFNNYFMDSATYAQRQRTASHELGHALGLHHSYWGNILYPIRTSQTYLGVQDIKDYNYLYPNN